MDFLIKIGWFANYALKVLGALLGGFGAFVVFFLIRLLSENGPTDWGWTWSVAFLGGLLATIAYEMAVAVYVKATGQWRS